MEDRNEIRSSENENGGVLQQKQEEELDEQEQHVLKFLDSMDSYVTLLDSLSSTLRQGWLEMASARHSMGASRINSALFDLKFHPAATSLQVTQDNGDSVVEQPQFTLCKWASPECGRCHSEEGKFNEDELLKKSNSSNLRHRSKSPFSELPGESTTTSGAPAVVDCQIQKERIKSLSVFGTLVSPKLRAAQHSFETALETLVEIANMRSSMLSAFVQVQSGRP
ncbi:uncharacterized protein LOC131162223 [Malania oleifera]|uniref:uncharacterized protein LOC131162223 n=1 Tax=Malania oleifera TaxID=397392 RepID=UPI0025AD9F6F|nr:uncharacterized protein LOC131162223 [Malania oleifera]